jgi:Ca2+-binding RTX toxin-like protein
MKRRRSSVKRILLLAAATALAVCLSAGVAFAQFGDSGRGVTKTCQRDCDGTSFSDSLTGSGTRNHIEGLGGNESPTFGDKILGERSADTLYGNQGGDKINGNMGDDLIRGGRNQDWLIGGPQNDRIFGGSGSDRIEVRDGFRDVVNCEGGNDNVRNRDSIDVLRNC